MEPDDLSAYLSTKQTAVLEDYERFADGDFTGFTFQRGDTLYLVAYPLYDDHWTCVPPHPGEVLVVTSEELYGELSQRLIDVLLPHMATVSLLFSLIDDYLIALGALGHKLPNSAQFDELVDRHQQLTQLLTTTIGLPDNL